MMSYCRWGSNSAVYVYPDASLGGITCCGCPSNDDEDFNCRTHEEMIVHLDEHRAKGHPVPDYAFERLRTEVSNG